MTTDKKMLNARVDAHLLGRVSDKVRADGVSLTSVITQALAEYVDGSDVQARWCLAQVRATGAVWDGSRFVRPAAEPVPEREGG